MNKRIKVVRLDDGGGSLVATDVDDSGEGEGERDRPKKRNEASSHRRTSPHKIGILFRNVLHW